MKAVLMTKIGAPEVLQFQDIAEPEISNPQEVKIRLQAASVNPIDTKLRSKGVFYPAALPTILGCDGAGEIVATGTEVSEFQSGDAVWFCNGGLGREQGNYAQYTVVEQRWLARKPPTVSFTAAAAAPLVLITAWGALFERGGLQAGQTVLIHAGAGGVGHVAIQLAKIKGARVITTVSEKEKGALVKSLGADEVIFYKSENFTDKVKQLTHGVGADVVLDTVGADVFKASIEATAHFGSLVTLLDPGAMNLGEARMRNLKIGFELMLTPMLRGLDLQRDKQVEILTQCGEWMQQERLQLHISQQLTLDQAINAHRMIEQGHTQGKIVLQIGK